MYGPMSLHMLPISVHLMFINAYYDAINLKSLHPGE